jgi:glucan phosphoethanolaminetransferase (alkaline phosphatase superfamily)
VDYFLDKLIEMLVNKNALLIYISDHGEILGEDNLWLHATDHEAAKYPACLVWMSEKYIYKNCDKLTALIANKDKKWKTDFVFHSILSAANIPSEIIQADLDIFSTQE